MISVLIYQDYVHSTYDLYEALSSHFGSAEIGFCDADNLEEKLQATTRLFVMPGGADLYYCEKLSGAPNAALRRWVEAGGTYLGICAGAYYACASIDWASDTAQAISGTRELGFSKGIAHGPVYDFLERESVEHSWLAAVSLHWRDLENDLHAIICYEGGPIFEEGRGTVLARYDGLPNRPPAIVEHSVGLGRAILCSPHIERSAVQLKRGLYKHRNASYEWEKAVIDKLERNIQAADRMRCCLFNHALKERANAEYDSRS